MKTRSLALGSVASIALMISGAFAADLPVRAPAPAPVVFAPIFTWTGFYVGVNAGYAGDKFKYPYSGTVDIGRGGLMPVTNGSYDNGKGFAFDYAGTPSITSSGGLFGAQIGYNWQFNGGFVIGVEADYQWSNIEGKLNINGAIPGLGSASLTAGSEITSFGTVRARLGYGWDRALLYVTGGWAYGRIKSGGSLQLCEDGYDCWGGALSKRTSANGWTVGAGLEYALTDNLSFKTEYLFVDFGDKTLYAANYDLGKFGSATANLKVDSRIHVVRAGLNYRFWTGGSQVAPVVARY